MPPDLEMLTQELSRFGTYVTGRWQLSKEQRYGGVVMADVADVADVTTYREVETSLQLTAVPYTTFSIITEMGEGGAG